MLDVDSPGIRPSQLHQRFKGWVAAPWVLSQQVDQLLCPLFQGRSFRASFCAWPRPRASSSQAGVAIPSTMESRHSFPDRAPVLFREARRFASNLNPDAHCRSTRTGVCALPYSSPITAISACVSIGQQIVVVEAFARSGREVGSWELQHGDVDAALIKEPVFLQQSAAPPGLPGARRADAAPQVPAGSAARRLIAVQLEEALQGSAVGRIEERFSRAVSRA